VRNLAALTGSIALLTAPASTRRASSGHTAASSAAIKTSARDACSREAGGAPSPGAPPSPSRIAPEGEGVERAPKASRMPSDAPTGRQSEHLASRAIPSPGGLFVGEVPCGAGRIRFFAARDGRRRLLRMQIVSGDGAIAHVTLGGGSLRGLARDVVRFYTEVSGDAFDAAEVPPRSAPVRVWSADQSDPSATASRSTSREQRPVPPREDAPRRPGTPRGRTAP